MNRRQLLFKVPLISLAVAFPERSPAAASQAAMARIGERLAAGAAPKLLERLRLLPAYQEHGDYIAKESVPHSISNDFREGRTIQIAGLNFAETEAAIFLRCRDTTTQLARE